MHISPNIRKVFQGVATRREMYRMFDRHAQRPIRWEGDAIALYAGEWFEIGENEHDYMLNILPPLWMRGEMFAMREFLTGSVTSILFALTIDGRVRHFHGYCDLSDKGSLEQMRSAIIERETRPVKAMTREERIEHIWSSTHDEYRRYASECCAEHPGCARAVVVCGARQGKARKLLEHLTDAEISAKLPVHLRYLPDAIAA
jgi:hypothetical protein